MTREGEVKTAQNFVALPANRKHHEALQYIGAEFLIETKVYYSPGKFLKGKAQLAYYCQSLGLRTGVYLVFCPNDIRYPEAVRASVEQIEGVEVRTYLVEYDEEKWE